MCFDPTARTKLLQEPDAVDRTASAGDADHNPQNCTSSANSCSEFRTDRVRACCPPLGVPVIIHPGTPGNPSIYRLLMYITLLNDQT